MRILYNYERDDHRRPMGTRCLVIDDQTGRAAFGMALCSDKDRPCKRVGRAISFGRAMKAFNTNLPHMEIGAKKDRKFFKAFNTAVTAVSRLNYVEQKWIQKQLEVRNGQHDNFVRKRA